MSFRRLSVRHFLLHGTRVAMFVAILFLIRWQHADVTRQSGEISLSLDSVQSFFPNAIKLAAEPDGAVSIFDNQDALLGTAIQTSPLCDHIIGFSGPTNVVIATDAENRIVGVSILSSGDTRDHLEQVVSNKAFMNSLNGLTSEDIEKGASNVDAVSGATLTSLAIRESILFRLGDGRAQRGSLRFPDPLRTEDVTTLFPTGTAVLPIEGQPSVWRATDANSKELGTILRSSPFADNVVGYQGPTDTLLGLDLNGRLVGIAIGKSFDNEPYVGYVRDDDYFKKFFKDQTLADLAQLDLQQSGVEGVSGATMTSMAVTEGMLLAAKERQRAEQQASSSAVTKSQTRPINIHDVGTLIVLLLGIIIGMTSLRSNRYLRIVFQLVLVIYLGLIAGNLVSQAMLVGWARHGLPWKSAFGLVLLSLAAIVIPMTTRRNLYCTHLCPHGALQQLIRNRIPVKIRMGRRGKFFLSMIPAMLLAWCIIVAMTALGFSLVDIEAFDAYLFRIAGWATITVALSGLVASLFVPMAYCRFGCPTGALLQFLRFNNASDRWSIRDWTATACLSLAMFLYWYQ